MLLWTKTKCLLKKTLLAEQLYLFTKNKNVMKVSFLKSIVMVSMLLAGAAHAQNQDSGAFSNHKFLYGIHLGLTDNKYELYSAYGRILDSQNSSFVRDDNPPSQDDLSSHARGFRLAVIGEAQLGRCFSLRLMPGLSLFRALKLESVRCELPVDVKFHPFRKGNLEPYIASGLCYGYDFASLRDDSHNNIKPLNAHDLRYTCGLGLDWYTKILKFGIEMKAGFNLLPPNTSAVSTRSLSYFYNGATFCLGINIEA